MLAPVTVTILFIVRLFDITVSAVLSAIMFFDVNVNIALDAYCILRWNIPIICLWQPNVNHNIDLFEESFPSPALTATVSPIKAPPISVTFFLIIKFLWNSNTESL